MNEWERKRRNKVAETLGLKNEIKPLELKENSLDLTEIDKDIYHDCVEQYDAMADNLEAGLEEYAPWSHLSEDMFSSLYKYNVNLNDKEDMKGFCQFNHDLMTEMIESEQYKELRKATQFDLMGSAIGTEVLQAQAMEKIKYLKEQYRIQQETGQAQPGGDAGALIEQLNQMAQTQQAVDGLQAKKDAAAKGQGPGLTAKEAQQLAELNKQLKDQQAAIDANKNGQKELKQEMNQTMSNASKDAKMQVDEVRDVVNAWGLDPGNPNCKISLEERKKAVERVRRSPRLKDMTDLIGRFRRLAMEKKKMRKPDGHNIKDIEVGNKIENVIPSEKMLLAHPTTKKDFHRRYHQKQLLQYQKEDIVSVGRGPIIVCHDKSGSMSGVKDDWATALSLATLEIAQKEKRDYAYIPYAGNVWHHKVKEILAGGVDPDDIMDIAETTANGGTDFMAPLNRALEFLQTSRFKKADILFITDGDAGITEEFEKNFKKIKTEKQFFVTTVLINVGGYGASRSIPEKFSDHIITISSLAELDDANAKEIFKLMDDQNKFDPQDPNAANPQQPATP